MRRTLCLLILAVLSARAAGHAAEYYVAPAGSDGNAGTKAQPFPTLERARDAVRALKKAGPLPAGGVTVWVRGGFYALPGTLTFTPEDSGTAGAPVVYRAFAGERPVLSGGRRITGWKVAAGRWEAALPDAAAGTWNFAQLYVNGGRRRRPRLPRQGYYYIAAASPPSPGARPNNFDRFRFGDDDMRASWSNLQDVEAHVFHTWSTSRLRVAGVDEQSHVATLTGPTFRRLARGSRYLVENVKEALGRPGEWYLDRKAGVLTYLPLPGEKPGTAVVVAPRVERLVEMKGDVAGRQWVEHVRFEGLTFAHANWVTPEKGWCVSQAEFQMPAGLFAEGARDCAFEGCTFTQMSAYALELGNGCKRNRVEGCEIADIGGGGVKIGPGRSNDDEALASHNVVRDCLIAHCGRMHPAAVGIWLGYGHHNTLEHNHIYDLYYSGISAGWSWGYGATPNTDNLIANNHIHDAPQNVLTDQGGIYTLGISPGTVLRGNVLHDMEGIPWAVGIYLDEGSSNILVEENLVYRVTTHAFNVNYGRENVARNNIFGPILDEKAPLYRCGRMEDHLSMTLRNNIIYWGVGDLVDQHWPTKNCVLDNNLYWNTAGPVTVKGKTFAEWQATGQDVHSLVADPLFVAPAKGDFRLKPGSPAGRIGFKEFGWSKAGRLTRSGEPTRLHPRAFPEDTRTPPEIPALPISQDYESLPVGAKDFEGVTQEENGEATARVTEETAASGKRSLKFTDAAGQKRFFNPHLYYTPAIRGGTWTGKFDLRWEAGALVSHDWRDGANPFHTGPSFQVGADGWLTTGEKRVAQMPAGQWVRFEITCALGEKANGKWNLTVRVPGRDPLALTDLPCSKEFKTLEWFGFVSCTDGPSVFYLDNVGLGQ